MDNFSDDGTVAPHGLLNSTLNSSMDAFNRTYKNTALRVGVIVQSYPIGDPNNRTNLAIEYDVICIQQNENRAITSILYKNCLATFSLGGIADYFEMYLRPREKKQYKGDATRLAQQDGSCVIILCLDGTSDKAVIVGGFPHPDRETNITTAQPQLFGGYNGVEVSIGPDGTATFTWNGPTNNDGSPVTPSLTPTVATVQADGSFQINHKTITFRLDINGQATLTATGDVDINCDNANIIATGNALVQASGTATVEAPEVKLGANAAESVIKGDTFKKMVYDVHQHPTPIGISGPPVYPMDPNSLSKKVKTE
jgi:hypothetical protein